MAKIGQVIQGKSDLPKKDEKLGFDEVSPWITLLEEMQNSGKFRWAEDTLEGIHDWVTRERHITEKQKSAVRNIAEKRGWGDEVPND